MGAVSSKEEEQRRVYDERMAQLRVYRGFKMKTLWYPRDGSEPMILHAPSIMIDFLVRRVLLLRELPLLREVQWIICHSLYWGDVSNVIHNAYTNPCVRKRRQ